MNQATRPDPAEISLRPVTKDNYEAVCDLPLPPEQQRMLADNCWSLVEAAYNPGYVARAIYLGEQVSGFMMWVPETAERISIWRFMISAPLQGQGLGSRALQLAIAEIRSRPGLREIEICYHPGNEGSRRLYARHGFVEQGLDAEGEDMLAVLTV